MSLMLLFMPLFMPLFIISAAVINQEEVNINYEC